MAKFLFIARLYARRLVVGSIFFYLATGLTQRIGSSYAILFVSAPGRRTLHRGGRRSAEINSGPGRFR